MLNRKLSWLSIVSVGLLGVAAYGPLQVAQASTGTATWGTFQVAGLGALPVETIQTHGDTDVSVWYLKNLFNRSGWSATWDGHKFDIESLPMVATSPTVALNQVTLPASLLVDGTTQYIDISHVAQSLHGNVSFDSAAETLSLHLALTSARFGPLSTTATKHASVGLRAPISHRASAAASTTSTKPVASTAAVVIGGRSAQTVPLVTQGGQAYVPLTELGKALAPMGIQFTNHQGSILVTGLPVEHAGVKLQAPELSASSSTAGGHATVISLGADWYVPVQALAGLGFQVTTDKAHGSISLTLVQQTNSGGGGSAGSLPEKDILVSGHLVDNSGTAVSGEVTLEDAAGNLHTLTTDASGAFSATVPSYYPTTDAAQGSDLTLVGAMTPQDGWVTQYANLTAQGGTVSNVTVDAAGVQLFSTVQGHVEYGTGADTAMPVAEVSVRNMITQAHYYAPVDAQGNFTLSAPIGPYEVFALITQKSAIYSLQQFAVTPGSSTLTVAVPAVPSGGKLQTQHAVVVAGDSGVSSENLLSVANIFEHVYPMDEQSLHLSEQGPITITLYSTLQAYAQHFQSEGYSQSEAQQIAQNSGAVTEGPQSIVVPMASFGEVDGLNVFAHELSHALMMTESLQLPSWAGEGLAWHQGVLGQLDGSPSDLLLQGAEWTQWFDIVQHQSDNTLLSLGTAGPLDGSYNVEAQDYYAMQDLINRFGMKDVLDYVNKYDKDAAAFQDVFGTEFSTFSQQVTNDLMAQAAKKDKGFTITFRVLTGGPSDLYVQNRKGVRILVSGLQPNQTYTLSCDENGQVTLPSTLTSVKATALSQVVEGDWYFGVGVGADGKLEQSVTTPSSADTAATVALGPGYRQEFEIANQFGVPFVVRSIMYDQNDQVLHAYPSLALPAGLELVSLNPIS